MTKYILHGGDTSYINPDNDGFFREITLGTKGKTTILLNYFSRKDDEVEKCAEQDEQRFLQHSENKNLAFEIARPENLAEQLGRSDVMYMRGGETKKLLDALSLTKNIEKLFKNKIIAGSSAGAYALGAHYWENGTDEMGNGLWVLEFKVLCHYTPERNDRIEKLLKYGKEMPLLILPDYKWVVLFK